MACTLVVPVILLSLFAAPSAQTDWCNFEASDCQKGEHTLCLYPTAGPAKACLAKGDLGGGISDTDKRIIVNMHNQLRLTVAKGYERRGSNGPQPGTKTGRMPNLQWDDDVAAVAQRWADQCNFTHDVCRRVPAHCVGQNLASMPTAHSKVRSIDIQNLVILWYNEVKDFDRNEIRRYTAKTLSSTGHYTQMVWAASTKIGCGLRTYYTDGWYRHYLVCNYGPSGNVFTRSVYET